MSDFNQNQCVLVTEVYCENLELDFGLGLWTLDLDLECDNIYQCPGYGSRALTTSVCCLSDYKIVEFRLE